MTVGLLVDKLQAFRQNAIVSVGVVVGSVIISIITEAANRPQLLAYEPPLPLPPILSPSSPVVARLPFDVPIVDDLSVDFPTIDPLIVAAGPTRTIQPPPTTAHSMEDITSEVGPLILTFAATVLAAGVGLVGVDNILYGGSPGAWPPPPGAKGDGSGGGYPDDAQEASWGDEDEEDEDYEDEDEEESEEESGGGEEEEEEEQEESEDEADGDDGPPPPPPDPPAKIEECPKLPRRTPIWLLVWLVCVLFQFMVGAFLARRLGGFGSLLRRMKKGPRPARRRVVASTPRAHTLRAPQHSPRPAPLSRSRPPLPPPVPVPSVPTPAPPPPPPPPTPRWAIPHVPPPSRRFGNFVGREIVPRIGIPSGTVRLPGFVYRWMADLFHWVAGVVVSAVEVAWRVVSRDWAMDVVALGLVYWLWHAAARLAGTVVGCVFGGDTLIEEVIGRKRVKGTPRPSPRVGTGRPADTLLRPPVPMTPTTPTPRPQRAHTGNVPVHQMWQPPPAGAESSRHDSLDHVSLDVQGHTSSSSRDVSRDAAASQHIDVLELVIIRQAGTPRRPGRLSGPESAPEPASPRAILSKIWDMYAVRTSPACSLDGSVDGASMEVQGRDSYDVESREFDTPPRSSPSRFASRVTTPVADDDIHLEAAYQADKGKQPEVHPPPPETPARQNSPGLESTSPQGGILSRICDMYAPRTSPAPPTNALIDEASMESPTHDSYDIESWYMEDPRRAQPPSSENRPDHSSPARTDIFGMYAPQTGPSPRQGPLDEASVDVQGRSRGSVESEAGSGLLELPSNLLHEQPPSRMDFSHDSAWGEDSDIDGNRSILRGLQRDVREPQARWSPPHTSSPCRPPQARWTVAEMYEPWAGPAPARGDPAEEGSLEVEGKFGASMEAVEVEPLPRPSSRLGFYGGLGSEGEGSDGEGGRAEGRGQQRGDGGRDHEELAPQPTCQQSRRRLTSIKRGVYGVLEGQAGPVPQCREPAEEGAKRVQEREPHDPVQMVHELPPNCPPSVRRSFTPTDNESGEGASRAPCRGEQRDAEEAKVRTERAPSSRTPRRESSPGRRSTPRWTVPEMYNQRTGPAPRPQDSIDEASLDVLGKGSCGSIDMSTTETASTSTQDRLASTHRSTARGSGDSGGGRRTPSQERGRDVTERPGEHLVPATWAPQRKSSPRSRPAACPSISDMYQAPTRPAPSRRNSVDEASLDVEGRGPRDSMEIFSTEEVESIIHDQPLSNYRHRASTPNPGASNRRDGARTPRREPQRDGEESEACQEHLFPATWAPQRESSPRSRPTARWSIADMYEVPTRPAPPRRNSVDEASLDVQGRGSCASIEMPSMEAADLVPANPPPRHTPAPTPPAVAPSMPPMRSGISRGPTTRSALPTRTPMVHTGQGEALPETRPSLQRPTPRSSLTATGRPQQGTSGSELATGSMPTRTPSPVASGSSIPRTSSIRRPASTFSSPAPPPSTRPPPVRSSSSTPRTDDPPEKPSVAVPAPRRVTFAELTLPLSEGSFDNALLVDTTLPSFAFEDSYIESEKHGSLRAASSPLLSRPVAMEGWEQRLLDGSFPSDLDEGSGVWTAPGQRDEGRREKEDVPTLRLITSSGFSLDVDVED